MNPPSAVRLKPQRPPVDRPQNTPGEITPQAVEGFAYYLHAFAHGNQVRYLSVWGWPWWTADRMTGYGSGAYGAGPYGTAENAGEFGALRYGRGAFGTGGYS